MRCRVVGVIVTLTLSLLPAPLTANAQPSRNLALLSPYAFSSRRTKSSAEPCKETTVLSNLPVVTQLHSHTASLWFNILVQKNNVQETCAGMSIVNRSQVMWAPPDVFGLFSGSVGSFSDNLGLGGVIFSFNAGTKPRCSRAGRLMFSGRYNYAANPERTPAPFQNRNRLRLPGKTNVHDPRRGGPLHRAVAAGVETVGHRGDGGIAGAGPAAGCAFANAFHRRFSW
jgi:hypothetical protein